MVENLILPPHPKMCAYNYAASSMVTADLEVCVFTDGYPSGSDFQTKYAALVICHTSKSAVTIDSPLSGFRSKFKV
jgi:hypothetical protein